MITNAQSGTTIDEIAAGIYRINTPVPESVMPGGFSFNQYLVRDAEPLLFHTGPRALFPLVSEAIGHVLPVAEMRYVAFSHVEADECGSLNDFLTMAKDAEPVVSRVAACGDLFTQGGSQTPALTSNDILGPSERFRHHGMPGLPDFWSESRNSRATFARLAATNPTTLACMHGSAWTGDGAALIMALADTVG